MKNHCYLWGLLLSLGFTAWGACQDVPAIAIDAGRGPAAETCPGWLAAADVLYWRPRLRGLDFASLEDQTQALTLGTGAIQNLQHDRDAGLRLGIGYRFEGGWNLGFQFTDFATESAARVDAPVNGGLSLFATRGHPDNQLEQATAAQAIGDFDYRVFDLEAGRQLAVGSTHDFRIFGGLRWANFGQLTRYQYDGLDFSQAEFLDRNQTQAFGLRGGAEAGWHWTDRLRLFGRLGGTVGWGRVEARWTEQNFNNTQLLVDIRDQYDQAMPALDMALGLEWRYRMVTLAAGYEAINWFNAANRSSFPDDFLERAYVPTSQDLLIDGLFLRLVLSR